MSGIATIVPIRELSPPALLLVALRTVQ